jgi:hypothetical protein
VGDSGSGSSTTSACITSEAQLRDDMRKLWTDHVAYTRFYIMESIAGLPAADATAARLLQNQDDIGNAIKPFYGDAAGTQLSALLRAHILGAVDVLNAAKANDAVALRTATDAWYANADQIARFLADANPNLKFEDMRDMMHTHLDQTLAEATARLTGDWEGDVHAFDAIVAHIRDMADQLTFAIEAQFPNLVSHDQFPNEDQHLLLRALWEDHVIWTRVVIISAVGNTPACTNALDDLDAAVARLLQNQVDIGNAVRARIGDAQADQLTALLHDHITIALEIVLAAKVNDQAKVADASGRWYANADAIAKLLSTALGLPYDAVDAMMREHLDQTTAEAVDRIAGNYAASIKDYDAIVAHILDMADAMN